jgi:hypothetical protein
VEVEKFPGLGSVTFDRDLQSNGQSYRSGESSERGIVGMGSRKNGESSDGQLSGGESCEW